MKIIFPHIPKCAGSSLRDQLKEQPNFYTDYYNHPTWCYAPDIDEGKLQQKNLKKTLNSHHSWIVYGHFAANAYYDMPYDYQFMLLRDPLERAISHFHYIRQLLPDNEMTRRRHLEVGPIKDNKMQLDEFIQLNHIRFIYSKYYLKNLQIDSKLIILPVDRMQYSLNLLGKILDFPLNHEIKSNQSDYSGDFEYLRSNFIEDTDLYNKLINHTNLY